MTELERDRENPYVEWIAREAKRSVLVDPAAKRRVMEAVYQAPQPLRRIPTWERLVRGRPVALSPLASLALAAGLVGIGVLAGVNVVRRDGRTAGQPPVGVARTQLPVHDTIVKFVLVAPSASNVSVVGDFNDWNASSTPMRRTPAGGMWSVAVPLPQGRHVYAFVVDGKQWLADPTAPLAPADAYGAPNSVVLVGGTSS